MTFFISITLFLILGLDQDAGVIYVFVSPEKSENHYFLLEPTDDKPVGYYFGSEDSGGHGVFFYLNQVENLTIDDVGNIEFEIGDRQLYENSRFRIIKSSQEPDEPIGISRYRLKYQGEITSSTLKLICISPDSECWQDSMTFNKLDN